MSRMRLLLIDDDSSLLQVLEHQLRAAGYDVTTGADVASARARLAKEPADVVVTDLSLPDGTGLEVLELVRKNQPGAIVIVITAFGTVENAIEACRLGADDYLTKPFSREQLSFALEKARRLRTIESENVRLRSELLDKFDFDAIVARSPAMQEVLKMAARVALSESTVLLQGESGTGKEVVARAIHANSNRREAPLITVNCPSIPDHLLESELFGHVKGAFTGAIRDRRGKFELADGGTLFLDEIGDLKQELQAKLLRTLQTHEIERVGGESTQHVDVRIIAATNQDLRKQARDGKFREDLYYRLAVFPITIPALRQRPEDIPALAQQFLSKFRSHRAVRITAEALDALARYSWPGNVRELENAIERALILTDGEELQADALPRDILHEAPVATDRAGASLPEMEKTAILRALAEHNGNQTAAARSLGVPRHVLLYRLKKYDIQH